MHVKNSGKREKKNTRKKTCSTMDRSLGARDLVQLRQCQKTPLLFHIPFTEKGYVSAGDLFKNDYHN